MCEPGSPAKRYGGVHTGGEYNIQNDTRLCTSTCRAAPQFPPNPLDAAPAVGCTRARSCRGPAAGPPRSSVVVVVAAPAVPAHRDRPGHCRLPRGGPASAATAKRRLKSAAEATMATRTSSLPSEATITETTIYMATQLFNAKAGSTVPPSELVVSPRLAAARALD